MDVREARYDELEIVALMVNAKEQTKLKNMFKKLIYSKEGAVVLAFDKNGEVIGILGAKNDMDGMTGEDIIRVILSWILPKRKGIGNPAVEMMDILKLQSCFKSNDVRFDSWLDVKDLKGIEVK